MSPTLSSPLSSLLAVALRNWGSLLALVALGAVVLAGLGAVRLLISRRRRPRPAPRPAGQAAEDELLRTKALLQGLVEYAPLHICLRDTAEWRYLVVNQLYAEGLGLAADALVGRRYEDVLPAHLAAAWLAEDVQVATTGMPLQLEARAGTGEHGRILLITKFPVFDSHGAVAAVGVIAKDITERKLAEQALQASEARLRTLVQHIPGAAVMLFDADLRYLVADGRGLAPLGLSRETMEGRTLPEVVPPDMAARLEPLYRATLAGQPPAELDFPATGHIYRMRFLALPSRGPRIGMLLAMDITQLRRDEAERLVLQQRLLERQRLESIGTLAGGLAHDFNNLLQAVLGHAELLRFDLPDGSPLASSVHAISAGAQRAAELTAQLLAYAGKGPILLRPVALNQIVSDLGDLTRTALPPQARVQQRLEPHLPLIEGDAVQLRQVVLNLLLNGSEALGEGGGTIVVETAVEQLGPDDLSGLLLGEGLPAGAYVRLTVCDTGHGMDAETASRVFEPFFSTRFTGRGLGLAAVHGIVRGHRGAIRITSAPGQGTAVQVWLPAAAPAAAPARALPAAGGDAHGVVVVIDDDPEVRAIARRMLERLGFAVREAAGGAAGLDLLAGGVPGLAGVLLDLTMPEMGGDVVAQTIAERHPGTRVVLMSGYSVEEIRVWHGDLPVDGLLQKPFSVGALGQAFWLG